VTIPLALAILVAAGYLALKPADKAEGGKVVQPHRQTKGTPSPQPSAAPPSPTPSPTPTPVALVEGGHIPVLNLEAIQDSMTRRGMRVEYDAARPDTVPIYLPAEISGWMTAEQANRLAADVRRSLAPEATVHIHAADGRVLGRSGPTGKGRK
jgi:hypothetical protein